jgi:hypothetical protein
MTDEIANPLAMLGVQAKDRYLFPVQEGKMVQDLHIVGRLKPMEWA